MKFKDKIHFFFYGYSEGDKQILYLIRRILWICYVIGAIYYFIAGVLGLAIHKEINYVGPILAAVVALAIAIWIGTTFD